MRYAISLVVILQGPEVLAAQEFRATCLPPIPPDIALPVEALRAYRSEISIEFETYFRDVTRYITCLDHERGAALTEAHAVTQAYTEFLELVTNDENE